MSAEPGVAITIEAVIELSDSDDREEDTEITGALLYYRTVGDSTFTSDTMSNTLTDSLYTGVIPLESVTTAGVEYYIMACSNDDTETEYYWSRLPEYSDEYYLIEVSSGVTTARAGYTDSTIGKKITVDAPEPGDGEFSITPMGQ